MSQVVDQRSRSWMGRTLIDPAGQRIGRVEDIYTDDVGGHPAWIAVATGRFGLNIIFLPFAGATPAGGDELRVQFPKNLIKEAPVAGAGGRLTQEEVVRLYDHYGFDLEAEEVRERAMSRRPNRPRSSYRPASRHDPATAAQQAAPPSTPAAPAEDPPRKAKAVAAAEGVASPLEEVAAPLAGLAAAPEEVVSAPLKPAVPPEKVAPAPVQAVAAPATPAVPARDPRMRPASPLFRNIVDPPTGTEEPDAARDSPLFWNHDDRIDSIRPPREPVRPGHR